MREMRTEKSTGRRDVWWWLEMAQLRVAAQSECPRAPIDWMSEHLRQRGEFHSREGLHTIVYELRHRKKLLTPRSEPVGLTLHAKQLLGPAEDGP